VQPARWVVYLGKFASAEALRARKAELRAARVDHRDVNNPALQPGLALGTFPTEAAANQALRDATRNGIKNAKVVTERPETRQHTLTLQQATPALQDSVRGINSGLADSPALDWLACPG
jgi:hydrogenase maturation factor